MIADLTRSASRAWIPQATVWLRFASGRHTAPLGDPAAPQAPGLVDTVVLVHRGAPGAAVTLRLDATPATGASPSCATSHPQGEIGPAPVARSCPPDTGLGWSTARPGRACQPAPGG
jgi:hypothetical protein